MAESTEDLHDHRNNLKRLCRVCGGKLKKSKEKYECSYSCIDHKELLAEKYQLNIEKDNCDIHPSHFCNACYVTLTRESSAERGPIFWEIHTDSCKTCFTITESQSKGGRPRKPKRGRKPNSEKLKSTATHSSLAQQELQSKIQNITQTLASHRTRDFDASFTFIETLNEDFNCPICKDILDKPLETTCEHYFCASCLSEALANQASEACPVCKLQLSDSQVKPATRMILRLIGEIKVGCKRCKTQLNYEDTAHHVCLPAPHLLPPPASTGQQPLPAPAVVPPFPVQPTPTVPTLQDALEELRQGKVSPEVEKLGTMYVKSKLKASTDGRSALLKTQGKVSNLVKV